MSRGLTAIFAAALVTLTVPAATAATPTKTCVEVIVGCVYVREAANSSADQKGYLKKGQKVWVRSSCPNWCRLERNGNFYFNRTPSSGTTATPTFSKECPKSSSVHQSC